MFGTDRLKVLVLQTSEEKTDAQLCIIYRIRTLVREVEGALTNHCAISTKHNINTHFLYTNCGSAEKTKKKLVVSGRIRTDDLEGDDLEGGGGGGGVLDCRSIY